MSKVFFFFFQQNFIYLVFFFGSLYCILYIVGRLNKRQTDKESKSQGVTYLMSQRTQRSVKVIDYEE